MDLVRILYTFLFTIAFIFILPYFVVAGILRGKYLASARQRFGSIPVRSDGPSLWVHAVSVGEFAAARALIRRLQSELPGVSVFVSTTTLTGQNLANSFLPGSTFYFPFDWRWTVRKVLKQIRPALVLVLETEIWPNFLWEAQSRGIPVVLINGRISDRSYGRYRLVRSWLPRFRECLMQSEIDAERMRELGYPSDKVHVMGNLKYDFRPPELSKDLRSMLEAWKEGDLLWVAGSTMAGEEEQILDLYAQLRLSYSLKLLIAPRHPERFGEVARQVEARKLSLARRSSGAPGSAEVLVLDSIGELAAIYELADLVLLGGTIGPYGGHNPVEPAYFGKAVVTGPHYGNFRTMFRDFLECGGILVVKDWQEGVRSLLAGPQRREEMGRAARDLVLQNAGSTEFVLKKVNEYWLKGDKEIRGQGDREIREIGR